MVPNERFKYLQDGGGSLTLVSVTLDMMCKCTVPQVACVDLQVRGSEFVRMELCRVCRSGSSQRASKIDLVLVMLVMDDV